jgi:methionyl-tRNA formyltransferase
MFNSYLCKNTKIMLKKPRIVFMGTPDFAVRSLEKIIENGYDVVGVVTAADKPAGRGKKIQKSAVKKFAEEKGLKILQPQNLKSKEFIEELKSLKPDIQVVVAFRMLPEVVWKLPGYGTFNLHASLLPDYRGAAPINWAIINGENTTGVTTFFIDEKIDTGEIILQKEVKIDPEENASSLHDKLMDTGAELVIKTIELIASRDIKTKPQSHVESPKKAPKLNKENTRIYWNEKGNKIYNLIRGLSMYPGAWTELSIDQTPKKLFIYKSRFEPADHPYQPGQVIVDKKQMKIAVKDGFILPEIIKLQGKKMMDIKSFLNGLKNKENISLN